MDKRSRFLRPVINEELILRYAGDIATAAAAAMKAMPAKGETTIAKLFDFAAENVLRSNLGFFDYLLISFRPTKHLSNNLLIAG